MNSQITITQVENGFLVTMPMDIQYPLYGIPNNDFRSQAKIMKEEFFGDEKLISATNPKDKSIPEIMNDQKQKNITIHKDFMDVLAYLSKQMKI